MSERDRIEREALDPKDGRPLRFNAWGIAEHPVGLWVRAEGSEERLRIRSCRRDEAGVYWLSLCDGSRMLATDALVVSGRRPGGGARRSSGGLESARDSRG